ncbi:hypothetical protein LOK49_LG13G01406 [Camellia lanceoleosa]|uniref:Uncharacterized protein n=1 Tax=Camellia lanceoleosa TaxID=1840588 RepID=A0ACC0FJE4_9ERIC|nr:hypothetical protein LOK49_LG13G01406 [Camellia lanceoleosa]
MTKLCDLGRALKSGAKGLCFSKSKSKSDYMRVGQEIDPIEGVCRRALGGVVGEKEATRIDIWCCDLYQSPTFGKLLEEVVSEYGFDHSVGSRYLVGYPSSRMSGRIVAAVLLPTDIWQ